ncbi:DUF1906 domain-containing protein [Pullulanibacillus sp. KACC 23026]|uniref:glycoside hydrolase domain-containing protein n=1 Tax=Pullulanibacillus sp. KACC 23026 TaxID=3028315 RepID=UPI0023AFA89E|nr:glycoside hydrolase domain-containing protein [Pullulanibacillus sp. KACC 23026]WEG11787.1 DUF1906 domain-containing protein [Pullulanibacillus sp. KACC 23026]
MATYWGVDSAAPVTTHLYNCVMENLGKPAFWGRYLKTVQGSADGLTAEEIKRIHSRGTKILPIYSSFQSAVGYRKGSVEAQNAIYYANRLEVPKGAPIFANVEKFFDVDANWLNGWFEAFYRSPYQPAYYFDSEEGNFMQAFCEAIGTNKKIKSHTILWSAQPEPGETPANRKPAYKPIVPPCGGNVWGWQYGRNVSSCPVDTDLVEPELYLKLW